MMKRYIFLLMMLISVTTFAQEKLRVEHAVKIALEKNYGILTARNNSMISLNKATLGNAGLLPKLDVSAMTKYTDTEQDVNDSKEDIASTNNNASINLSYTLVNGLGNIYNYKKLKLQADGVYYQTKYKIETTVFNVVSVYYTLAQLQDNLEKAVEMLDISKERLARAETKTAIGTGSSLDVLNARVDFNVDSVSYLNAEKGVLDAKRNLNILLSRDVNYAFSIDTGIVEFKEYQLDELLNSAFQKNSDYLLAVIEMEQANYDLKIAKSSMFPTLSLTSSYGYNQMNRDFDVKMNNSNASLTTGLTLSWNIFDGSKKTIQRNNAKINIENFKYKVEEQKLSIQRDISNAYATYENNLKVLSVERSNLKSAELNFNQSKEYYNLGQITSTRFREAQLNLLTAKNSISAAKYAAKVTEMDLNRICGMIVQEK